MAWKKRRQKKRTTVKCSVYNSIKASPQLLLFPLNHFSIWRRRVLGVGGEHKKQETATKKRKIWKNLAYKISARRSTAHAKNELIRLFYTPFYFSSFFSLPLALPCLVFIQCTVVAIHFSLHLRWWNYVLFEKKKNEKFSLYPVLHFWNIFRQITHSACMTQSQGLPGVNIWVNGFLNLSGLMW